MSNNNDEKRQHRQLKRDIKKAGKRKLRRRLERDLARDPEKAAESEIDYGRFSSEPLNGNDHDATRRPRGKAEEGGEEE